MRTHAKIRQRRQSRAHCVGSHSYYRSPHSKLQRAKFPVKENTPSSCDAAAGPSAASPRTRTPSPPSQPPPIPRRRHRHHHQRASAEQGAMSVRPATAKKQQAYLVELHDDEDLNDALKSSADMLRSEVSEVDKITEEQVSLPVVIDVKTTAGGKGDPNTETGGEPQICCFTCYIGPCPEVINTNFKHPEFMICYRDDNSQCINGMMRYYCCPLYLATYKKDGEDTFELRAVQTETNIGASHAPNSGTNGYATGGASGPSSQGTNTHTSYHYYGGSGGGHPLHGMPSCHSFSQHHFNCRTMPPQFNFLHHCSCSCPPQMMAYCLNYRCQNGQAAAAAAAGMAPHAAAGQQYRQFAYHPPTYMYTTQGNSAMG